ncbi:MAG: DUF2628 domain-containing protein [Stenotrophomonas indicatrix]|uniref:DUF2628 domain-containing protein n=1 Tax=Stenotrophomonas indicatrix TaxID=2045451 RepID=UPI002898DB73|nr:DUF2628 domain-containing protein [Stenotrophomonas indicatrix]
MSALDPQSSPGSENPYLAPGADADVDTALEDADYLTLVVGPNAAAYRRFWHVDSALPKPPRRWNWPAFLFGTLWMVHRRMYLAAIGFYLVTTLLPILMLLADAGIPQIAFGMLLPRIALAIFANALYLRHCSRLLARVQATHAGQPNRIRAELLRRGGTRASAVVVCLGLIYALRYITQGLLQTYH